jgi:predicted metal-dependent enzyme (double-stranded beta helix superfamily)
MSSFIPECLEKLIGDLSHNSMVDNHQVVDTVRHTQLSLKELLPFSTFNHPNMESYGRRLIFDNGNFKILLMSWKPGDFTAIHNHGYTEWGCVYFFGEATHRLYQVENNRLVSVVKDSFLNGQIASVCGDLTHLMGNAGTRDLATLHIYGSNTRFSDISENAHVYVPERQKIYNTMGTAFLNMDQKLILSETPLQKSEKYLLDDYFELVRPFYERNRLKKVLEDIEKQQYQFATA